MKLLHMIPSLDPAKGGPVEAVRQTTSVLTEMGHISEVLCLDSCETPHIRQYPFPVHALGPGMGFYGYHAQLVPWLRDRARDYDFVIVHGIWQYPSFAAWLALHRTDRRYCVYTHGMLDPWFKRQYPLKHLKKWLYWFWADYRVLRDAAAVFFTSEEEKILARQSFWLYRCNEAIVNFGTAAPTGDRDRQREVFLSRFPHLKEKRTILFLGRIYLKKGCDLLVEAFARVAHTDHTLHLAIAGPDAVGWQATLQQRAETMGVGDRITWTGMLTDDCKWGAFYAAEVFALPSHQENFGIAVTEALACGVPVLISNKVNIWREIASDRAGLVGDDTLAGTVTLLTQWLALSPAERRLMGDRARVCFAERFEIRRAVVSLLHTLANLP